jgi:D-cysteine desulfhydrase
MPDAALDRIPRVSLGQFPTPLQEAPRLSAAAGIPIWLKRDDLTGVGLGGNKVRPLEFLLGAALDEGCDVLVTGSGPQSNWAMLAALAARRCGLDSELCFYGSAPDVARGNLLLQDLTSAHITWTGTKDRASVDLLIEQTAERLRAQGRRPLVLPRGGATARGSIGYFAAAVELDAQCRAVGIQQPTVWLGTGSCGSQAGLVAAAGAGVISRVVGVTVSRPVEECRSRVAALASGTADLLGIPAPPTEAVEVIDGWIGPGYGIASDEGRAATDLVAATEAVILDPVFGAKAMAALLQLARAGAQDRPVVFLVSGGAPTLFAQGGDL